MTTLLTINGIITLSCHAYLFPLFGTGQHPYPRSFSLLQKFQALLVLGASIVVFDLLIGIVVGVALALWSATIFMPIAIVLHLLNGVDIATQHIPTIRFNWDTLTNSINSIWTLSIISFAILMAVSLLT